MRRRPTAVQRYRAAYAHKDLAIELDELAARALPALTVLDVDGWRVRVSGGPTRRVNSVWPRRDGGRTDLSHRIETVERFYATRGRPACFQLSPAAEPRALDAVLGARGYDASGSVEVRVADIDAVADLPVGPPAATPSVVAESDAGWLAGWARLTGRADAEVSTTAAMLERVAAPSAYVLLLDGRTPVAAGRGVVDGGWLGVFDLATAVAHRRHGAARGVLAMLGRWGRREGAQRAYLAVEASSVAAGRLYAGAGFSLAYRYRYRTQPASP